jgi:hypothetical protein
MGKPIPVAERCPGGVGGSAPEKREGERRRKINCPVCEDSVALDGVGRVSQHRPRICLVCRGGLVSRDDVGKRTKRLCARWPVCGFEGTGIPEEVRMRFVESARSYLDETA